MPIMRSGLALVAAVAGLGFGPSGARAADPPAMPVTPATTTAETVIPAAALAADVAIMREAYESLHPGMLRYCTRAELDQRWSDLEAFAQRDRTLAEVYLAFSRLLASLRCGHAYCNFFNQSAAVKAAILTGTNRLPFHFRWIDRRMVITENRSADPRLVRGTEVRSINGRPAREILEQLLPLTRADGASDAKRVRSLEVTGLVEFEAFDVFFPLVIEGVGDRFDLVVAPPGASDSVPLTVPALTHAQRIEPGRAAARRLADAEPLWTLERIEDGAAILRMPSWAVYKTKWDWAGWLNDRVDELCASGTRALVVDLRGNEGGNDCGDVLLTRLLEREAVFPQLRRFVRSRQTPQALDRYLDTWDNSFRNWGAAATAALAPALVTREGEPTPTYYRLNRFDDDARGTVITPRGPRFAGTVYVLIDAVCSSATFQFALRCKQSRLATLVGEPTGGNQRGINGGAFFFLRLPGTGIEMDVPLIGLFPDDGTPAPPDGGVDPDVLVPTTLDDLVAGRDPQMDAVRRLISPRR